MTRPFERVIAALVMLVLIVPFVGYVWSIRDDGRVTDTTWARVRKSGVLRVGMDFGVPPFAMPAPDGVQGYDADLARNLATRLGVRAEIVNTPSDALHDALRTGKVDALIAALPPTPAYGIVYSAPYVEMGERAVVRAGSPLHAPRDLAGKRVGAELGSDGDLAARDFATRTAIRLNSNFDSGDAALAALHAGDLDAVALDGIAARRAVAHDPTLAMLPTPVLANGYVAATRQDAPIFTAHLARALDDARAAGVFDRLDARWLSGGGGN